MTRRTFMLAAALALAPAFAQDGDDAPFSLKDYPERMKAAVAACEAAPEGGDCRVQLMSVLPSTVEALSVLGYDSTYAESAPLLREMAAFPKPEIQAAAIYALARLGPTSEDLPVLREALMSDVPGVRRAAIGALKPLADPLAQELVARAQPVPSSYFEPDALPFDPAAMGIAMWPEGTRFLHFQRLRDTGTYVFIASGDVAGLTAALEAQAGAKAVGFGEIEARFGAAYGALLQRWSERNSTLGAVQAVILKDVAEPSERDVAVIALVYDDYALGAPGFAVLRLPGEKLPAPRTVEAADPPPPEGDAAIWYANGAFVPKDGAADDDIAAWREVLDAEGLGAAAYLDAFPNGAWRAEAEALLAGPVIETDFEVYAESDTIMVRWHGLPAGVEADLSLGVAGDERPANSQAIEQPHAATSQGGAELAFYPVIDPGVYEVRLVDANGEILAASEIRIAAASVKVTPERDSYKPGEPIAIAFSGMGGNPNDMLSIAKKGDPVSTQGPLRVETGGKAEGSVTVQAPQEPGDYEIRAWYGRDPRLRGRAAFTVRGPDRPPEIAAIGTPAVALAAESFPANEKITVRYAGLPGQSGQYIYLAAEGTTPTTYLTYVDAKDADGLVTIALPSEPGRYEIRAIVGSAIAASATVTVTAPAGVAMATLTLAKTSFAPGETIPVDFTGMSGAKNDYVALATAGARYRQYDSYVYTKGETAGKAELKAPTKPGAYEIRAFFNEDATVLRGVVAITVESPP